MLVEQLPILDLDLVDLRDMNLIAIADVSIYAFTPTSDQIALQITPPGYPTINVAFTPRTVNIYKAVDLNITCADTQCLHLPDGVYDVRYTINLSANAAATNNYTSISKKFIKVDEIKCVYEHAFLAIDLGCNCQESTQKKYIDELERAKLYITGSVAECNRGNLPLSFKYYEKAEYILNNIACKFAGKCSGRGFFSGCGCK